MEILKILKSNRLAKKEIDKITNVIGRPKVLYKVKGIKLYGYESYHMCYIKERYGVIPIITIFNAEESIHQAIQYMNYKQYRYNQITK